MEKSSIPDRKKLAEEWLERGSHDFAAAKLLFKKGHFTNTVAALIQQASEKYLKGYLIYKGWKLKKTHDLRRLVAEAMSTTRALLSSLTLLE